MNQQPANYNLIEEPWIPVLWNEGTPGRVGIRTALTKAGKIRQIAASNPMDNVALLRFLLAVLQWCKPSVGDEDHKHLESTDGIPQVWLEEKLGPPGRPDPVFELLGGGPRFFQDHTQAEERPNRRVSDLFAYLPADTEISHFRHVDDQTIALCPACCALGLVRLPACATQGGRGLSPSINNAPPIYFLRVGSSLMETFELNWPLAGAGSDDHPAWEAATPSDQIGVLEGLTWQPRAVWLWPLAQEAGRSCARCGASGHLVAQLAFRPGRSRKSDGRPWRDPHVAWSEETDAAARAPDPLKYSLREAELWVRTARTVLQSVSEGSPVPSLQSGEVQSEPPSALRVTCFQPFTKQKKTFDEHRDVWGIPAPLLANEALRARALGEIAFLEDLDVRKWPRALSTVRKAPLAARSAWTITLGDVQHRFRKCFARFLIELAEADTEEHAEGCVKRWRHEVHDVVREALDRTSSHITPGSPLRRREAAQAARRALEETLMKVASRVNGEQAGAGKEAKGEPD